MKISYRWLQEWLKLDISPQELADKLTMLGLEIDELWVVEQAGIKDVILDLSITANRGDCLGILGIARELAQVFAYPWHPPQIEFSESTPELNRLFQVQIQDISGCPRYTARLIRNVKIGPSPKWLVDRLTALGMRSINNVVDVTNYVLLEWGQPLHAFDFKKLTGSKIIVRRAASAEKLITLDNVERILDQEMLVIADSERAVALAGIMGGANTEVTLETSEVLLECAFFDPAIVRRTSRRLGLGTDSSYRFERGVDILALPQAINRAAQLIQQLAGGQISKGIIDEYPQPRRPLKVNLRLARVNRILGTNLSASHIFKLVERSGLNILKKQGETLVLEAPSYRSDILREIDVIEEIARIHGYQNISMTTPRSCVANNPVNKLPQLENRIRDILVNCGFWEAVNFSFTNDKFYCKLTKKLEVLDLEGGAWREGEMGHEKNREVLLKNPLSQDQDRLRTSLLPSLLENISINNKRQQTDVFIFELSTVYLNSTGDELPAEKRLIAGAMTGERRLPFWGDAPAKVDLYDIKGTVETLLDGLGITGARFSPVRHPYLYPAAQIELIPDVIGILGKLDPDTGFKLNIAAEVYVFELDYMLLFKHLPAKRLFEPLCRYPAIIRDMALIVPEEVTVQQVEDVVLNYHDPWLKKMRLFDVYRGAPLIEGKKSLAFSLCYQCNDKTLTEEEVNSSWERLFMELKQNLGASLRQ